MKKVIINPQNGARTLILKLDIHTGENIRRETVEIDFSTAQDKPLPPVHLLDWIQKTKSLSALAAQAGGHGTGVAQCLETLRKHLIVFLGEENAASILLADVDRDFCLRFVSYLNQAHNNRIRPDKPPRLLSANTRKKLFTLFSAVFRRAQREGLISTNPVKEMDRNERPHAIPTDRPYLTREELQKMIRCSRAPEDVRKAFLFSCLTGLRWSDICSLTWRNLRQDGDNWFIIKKMIKTGEWISNPIAGEARLLLPSPEGRADAPVFSLPSASAVNRDLKRWAKAAGLYKNISFHTARHTFATLLITEGADIYTTSKLLGHTSVETTQIYAKVVDQKKQEAITLISKALKK